MDYEDYIYSDPFPADEVADMVESRIDDSFDDIVQGFTFSIADFLGVDGVDLTPELRGDAYQFICNVFKLRNNLDKLECAVIESARFGGVSK